MRARCARTPPPQWYGPQNTNKSSMQPAAACGLQPAARSLQPAARSMQPAARSPGACSL